LKKIDYANFIGTPDLDSSHYSATFIGILFCQNPSAIFANRSRMVLEINAQSVVVVVVY
jgi:hypothetical protein